MRVNKNSSLHYKILKQDVASEKKPRKKTKRQTKRGRTEEIVSFYLLRGKHWNKSIQKALHHLEAQKDYKQTAI